MQILKKLDIALDKLLKAVVIICMTGLFIILVANIFFRKVPLLSNIPSFSMGWFDEVVEGLFAYLVMTTASILCRHREHFRVDLLHNKLKGMRADDILEGCINLIQFVFFVALLYYSWKLTVEAVQYTQELRIQKKWFYMCIPINSLIMCVYTLLRLIQNIRNAFAPRQTLENAGDRDKN